MKYTLSKREKYYVIAGVSLIAVFLVFQLILFPFFDAKDRTRRSIQAKEQTLKEITALSSEYQALKANSGDIQTALKFRSKEFTLFSFLEKHAGRAGVKSNITYMKPSTSSDAGPYKEASVEMKLEKITLKQLVDYLYLVESRKDLVLVKRISVKQTKGSPEYLTALIHLITYQE